MGAPSVTMRCPSCGQTLRAVLAPAPPTQWFPCPNCHLPVPVVVPRDLPPLYSWEVIPGLYPQLAVPRRPRWNPATVVSVALAVAAVLAALAAGLLGYDGMVASQPATYVVSGTVSEQSATWVPATVVLFTNGNTTFGSQTLTFTRTFQFTGVPAGGIELNVTARGFAPTVVYTFASRSYSTQTQGLGVVLSSGTVNNTTADVLTPFGDLTTLLSYVGGGAVLLGGAAVLATAAAVGFRRPTGAVLGVIGAGGAVAVPVVLLFLSLADAFPTVSIVAGVVGGAGAFALVFATLEVSVRGSEVPAP